MSVNHMKIIGKNDLWETPPDLFAKACAEFGIYPTLDVCATEQNTKCKNWYSKLYDGLKQNWDQDFFMNPPYSEIADWMYHAYENWSTNNVNGLILTFNKTDTQWWHSYVEGIAEVHFIKGRIKFELDGEVPITIDKKTGKPKENSSPYPSVWIIYRRKN